MHPQIFAKSVVRLRLNFRHIYITTEPLVCTHKASASSPPLIHFSFVTGVGGLIIDQQPTQPTDQMPGVSIYRRALHSACIDR